MLIQNFSPIIKYNPNDPTDSINPIDSIYPTDFINPIDSISPIDSINPIDYEEKKLPIPILERYPFGYKKLCKVSNL